MFPLVCTRVLINRLHTSIFSSCLWASLPPVVWPCGCGEEPWVDGLGLLAIAIGGSAFSCLICSICMCFSQLLMKLPWDRLSARRQTLITDYNCYWKGSVGSKTVKSDPQPHAHCRDLTGAGAGYEERYERPESCLHYSEGHTENTYNISVQQVRLSSVREHLASLLPTDNIRKPSNWSKCHTRQRDPRQTLLSHRSFRT